MGVKAMSWALESHHEDMTTATKMVLVSLADYANEKSRCWPSLGLLAERCLMSRRTVQRSIAFLEQHGFVSIERRLRQNGSHSVNIYTLNLSLKTKPQITTRDHCESPPRGRDTVSPGWGHSDTGVETQCRGGRDTVSPPEEPPNRTIEEDARAREGIPAEMRDQLGMDDGSPRKIAEEFKWIADQWRGDRVYESRGWAAFEAAHYADRLPSPERVRDCVAAWKRSKQYRSGHVPHLHTAIEEGVLFRPPDDSNPAGDAEVLVDDSAKPVSEWRVAQARMLAEEAEREDDAEKMELARKIEREHGARRRKMAARARATA